MQRVARPPSRRVRLKAPRGFDVNTAETVDLDEIQVARRRALRRPELSQDVIRPFGVS